MEGQEYIFSKTLKSLLMIFTNVLSFFCYLLKPWRRRFYVRHMWSHCSDDETKLFVFFSFISLHVSILAVLYFAFAFFSSPPPEFVPFFCSVLFSLGCWGKHNCIFVHKLVHFKCNTVVDQKKATQICVWAFSFLSFWLLTQIYLPLCFLFSCYLFSLCFIFRATPMLLNRYGKSFFFSLFHTLFCSTLPQ